MSRFPVCEINTSQGPMHTVCLFTTNVVCYVRILLNGAVRKDWDNYDLNCRPTFVHRFNTRTLSFHICKHTRAKKFTSRTQDLVYCVTFIKGVGSVLLKGDSVLDKLTKMSKVLAELPSVLPPGSRSNMTVCPRPNPGTQRAVARYNGTQHFFSREASAHAH